MEKLSSLLTDDCVLKFTNGEVVQGAEEVANVIMKCCQKYKDGYLTGMALSVTEGIISALVIIGAGVVITKLVKSKIKSKKLKLGD